jgi:glycosyltransferase involved in cell wall biosynthesis
MIEALSCGTPVVAFRCGSVPEVIDDGVSGFIVDDVAEAVAAVKQVEKLDRGEVRAIFEERFTADRMAEDYLAIYRGFPSFNATRARYGVPQLLQPRVA